MEDINLEAEKQKRRMYSVSDTDDIITIGNYHYLLLMMMMMSILTPFLQRHMRVVMVLVVCSVKLSD